MDKNQNKSTRETELAISNRQDPTVYRPMINNQRESRECPAYHHVLLATCDKPELSLAATCDATVTITDM